MELTSTVLNNNQQLNRKLAGARLAVVELTGCPEEEYPAPEDGWARCEHHDEQLHVLPHVDFLSQEASVQMVAYDVRDCIQCC
eukprot:940741-Prorocentrum_minimum.AAC.3